MDRLFRRLGQSKLFQYGVDRGFVALNLVVNSLILANKVDAIAAGVYFFSTSLTQLVVSSWLPALEMAWSGSSREERRQPVPIFFSECLVLTFTSALVCLAILFVASPREYLFLAISIPAVLATTTAILHMLLVRMRYEETSRFVRISVGSNIAALVLKITLALLDVPDIWLFIALFSDLMLVSIVSLAIWLREHGLRRLRIARPAPKLLAKLFWVALSIYATVFAARSLLVFARISLDHHAYAATGFAFQLVNAIQPLVSALTFTVRSHIGHAIDERAHVDMLVKKSVLFAVVLTVAYAAGVWLLGPSVIAFLMPDYADEVVSLLIYLIPFVPAALLTGVALAIAPRRPFSIGLAMFLSGLLGGLAFMLPLGGPGPRLLAWSSIMLAGSAILLWVLRSSPPDIEAPTKLPDY